MYIYLKGVPTIHKGKIQLFSTSKVGRIFIKWNYLVLTHNWFLYYGIGLVIYVTLCTTLFLMFTQFQEIFTKNYLLVYMHHVATSIIFPGLYFVTHPKNFKDSVMEMHDMIFWNFQLCEKINDFLFGVLVFQLHNSIHKWSWKDPNHEKTSLDKNSKFPVPEDSPYEMISRTSFCFGFSPRLIWKMHVQ